VNFERSNNDEVALQTATTSKIGVEMHAAAQRGGDLAR